MAGPRVDEDIAFGVRCNAANFAQIDDIRKRQRVGGIEGDLRRCSLCRGGQPGDQHRGKRQCQQGQKASHRQSPYRAADVFADSGCSMSFCTRQDSISPTMISFGLRQSIMWTTWKPPNSLLAWPNFPMMVPSSSIL